MKQRAVLIAGLSLASPAFADLQAKFIEGAPKDRFVLSNTGDCALPAARVTVDLAPAPAGLVFDVTASGAGVEVFQPFDIVAGGEFLRSQPTVLDGDTGVTLDLIGLGAGQSVAFTIDVDDTGGGREITVSNAEIAGAMVAIQIGKQTWSGTFDQTSQAVAMVGDCAS